MKYIRRFVLLLLVLSLLLSILPSASADLWIPEPDDHMSDEDFQKGIIIAVILLILAISAVVLYFVFKKRR